MKFLNLSYNRFDNLDLNDLTGLEQLEQLSLNVNRLSDINKTEEN